jgi:hypothetical protein
MDFSRDVLYWERVRPNPKKIKSFMEWQSPILAKGVKSFVRLTNFYKKFIRDFLTLAKLFTNLLELPFEWKDKQQKAFDLLKGKLSSTPVLQYIDFLKSFKVHRNASGFVIGGVFMQEGTPSCFFM